MTIFSFQIVTNLLNASSDKDSRSNGSYGLKVRIWKSQQTVANKIVQGSVAQQNIEYELCFVPDFTQFTLNRY